ncbi:MAG: pyridoxal-dependent decarboxylase [Legionellaceae bacterium]|nr:pyridoxal-dependent decarboxylase [Legionellaceae bacterium]
MVDLLNNPEQFKKMWQQVGETLLDAYTNPERHDVMNITPTLTQRRDSPDDIPKTGAKPNDVLAEATRLIFEGYCNVLHPAYYGYISPRPLPISLLGDILASGLNQTPGAWRAGPAATVIETEVIQWLAQFMGYPITSNKCPNGIITSGGTMANASALKLARDTIIGRETQFKGLAASTKQPVFYMSIEGHFSIVKSLDFMGFGRDALRLISTTPSGSIDIQELRSSIQTDLSNGFLPLCIIGVAGTSATGAIDDLAALAKVAQEHNIWFHVDAAAGGAFATLPMTKKLFYGLEFADSVTIDPCKWLFLSFGIGCLLVKDGTELYKSFNASGPYWEELDELDTFQMGFSGTRQWRSLGLWMAFKSLGVHGYWDLLSNNLNNAHYIASRISNEPSLELLSEPLLPVCCFRVIKEQPGMTLNATNKWVQRRIVAQNQHYITLLDWRGDSYLRISINNHTNHTSHLDALIDDILNLFRND